MWKGSEELSPVNEDAAHNKHRNDRQDSNNRGKIDINIVIVDDDCQTLGRDVHERSREDSTSQGGRGDDVGDGVVLHGVNIGSVGSGEGAVEEDKVLQGGGGCDLLVDERVEDVVKNDSAEDGAEAVSYTHLTLPTKA